MVSFILLVGKREGVKEQSITLYFYGHSITLPIQKSLLSTEDHICITPRAICTVDCVCSIAQLL